MKARENPRLFSPRKFRLEALLGFWAATILFPVLIISSILRYTATEASIVNETALSSQLLNHLETLQRNTLPEFFFRHLIEQTEAEAGFPLRSRSNLLPTSESLSESGNSLFEKFTGLKEFRYFLLIKADADFTNIEVLYNQSVFPDSRRPGNRAVLSILKKGAQLSQPDNSGRKIQILESDKLINNLAESVFGDYFSPLDEEEDFATGLIARNGGQKVFGARRFIFSPEGTPLFCYLALFVENGNLLVPAFERCRREIPDNFSVNIELRQAKPFPMFTNFGDRIELAGPIPYSLLNSGFFQGKSLALSLLKRGIMKIRPALFPFFVLAATNEKGSSGNANSPFNLLLLLIVSLTLLFLKHFHQTDSLKLKIRHRLLLCVFLATAMPAATFLFFSARHAEELLSLRRLQLKKLMRNHLSMLELTMKTRDEAIVSKVSDMVTRLHENLNKPADILYEIIKNSLHPTFFGASLFRNDGEVVQLISPGKLKAGISAGKFSLHHDLMHGSVIRLMQELNLMTPKYLQKLKSTPSGKKLLAIAGIFEPLDVDNFCTYEGQAQTSKQDFGTFRFLNFKLLPERSSPDKVAGIVLMAHDLHQIARHLLAEISELNSFFLIPSDEGKIETAVFSTFDMNTTRIDYSRVWPTNGLAGNHVQTALNAITSGKSEVILETENPDGIPITVIAKRIGRYPLIAVSQCLAHKTSLARENIRWLSYGAAIYLLLLMLILSSVLNELFARPIDILVTAARLIGEGSQVQIENKSQNEISHLTSEFSEMSRLIMERERLAKFISADAIDTIRQESSSLSEIGTRKTRKSIVFIHIKNFTSLALELEPESLIELLNEYFSHFEKYIFRHGGQIDKYISDAIMAVFSDEVAEQGSEKACLAVTEAFKEIKNLNRILLQKNLPQLTFSAGISTGMVISGRIGSYNSRLDFTVIGDKVNLAARLEAKSRMLTGSTVLIDQETADELPGSITKEYFDRLTVKGKSQAVEVYAIR